MVGRCLASRAERPASAAIGVNRGEEDRPVGLRTTMLVTFAAAISMIQVNLLLPIAGKGQDPFALMGLMLLPLGILSGMGLSAPVRFCGAATSCGASPPPRHGGSRPRWGCASAARRPDRS
jgi:hypothetical protein